MLYSQLLFQTSPCHVITDPHYMLLMAGHAFRSKHIPNGRRE